MHVDMIDRLVTPFGLVRAGIAPDHQKTKMVTKAFERTAANPRFRFFGNIEIGRTISIEKLRSHYDAVVFAHGSALGRRLGIAGDDLQCVLSANEFVGWYNGHPDFALSDIEIPDSVTIVGNGNVAGDVARLLLKPVEQLARTDITDRALKAIAASHRCVHVVGRKPIEDSRFSSPEFRELLEIPALDVSVASGSGALLGEPSPDMPDNAKRNVEYLREALKRPRANAGRQLIFYFGASPVESYGDRRIAGVKVAFKDGSTLRVPCGLLVQCIGNVGKAIDGLPFDETAGIVRNDCGRVKDDSLTVVPGLYVAGWAKRGAVGTVGTNRLDSLETCKNLVEDLAHLPARREDPDAMLRGLQLAGIRVFTYSDWLRINDVEIKAGNGIKPREKILETGTMLDVLAMDEGARLGGTSSGSP